MATTQKALVGLRYASPYIRALMQTVVYAGFAFFYVNQIIVIDYDKFVKHFPKYDTFSIGYKPYRDGIRMYPYYLMKIVVSGVPVLGGAVVTILAHRLPNDTKPRAMRWLQSKVRQAAHEVARCGRDSCAAAGPVTQIAGGSCFSSPSFSAQNISLAG